MELKYLPNAFVIVQDDWKGTPVAATSIAPFEGISIHVLGKAMAMAPRLVCLLDYIMDIEPDDYGDRTIPAEGIKPIREALTALSAADCLALIHFHRIVK